MPIEIRPAKAGDAARISAIKAAVWDDPGDAERIARVITEPDHATLVAVYDGVVAGFVDSFLTLSRQGVCRWEIDLLAVHPDCQRWGLARQLIAASTASGREMGASLARAAVRIDNIASQKTFARCGYRLDDTVCELHVSPESADTQANPPDGAHLIPVNTFNYCGIWLEGEISPEAIAAAQGMKTRRDMDVVGAVVPVEQRDAVGIVRDAGFNLIGQYQWLLLDFRKV